MAYRPGVPSAICTVRFTPSGSSGPASQAPMAAAWVNPAASICSRTTRATFSTLARSPGLSGPTPGRFGGTTWMCASIMGPRPRAPTSAFLARRPSNAHHVVPAVHEQGVPGDGSGERAAQEHGGVGDLFRFNPARQWRPLGRVVDGLLDVPDALGGPRGVRAGGDQIDPDVF